MNFCKGVNPGFWLEMLNSLLVCFGQKRPSKMCRYVLNRKEVFLDYKNVDFV